MIERFYVAHLATCDRHRDKAAGYVVKARGEIYRYACTKACANTQAAELNRARRTDVHT